MGEQTSGIGAVEGAIVGAADIAWVLMSTALVMLMTPALAFFYGGLVRRKCLHTCTMHDNFCRGKPCLVLLGLQPRLWTKHRRSYRQPVTFRIKQHNHQQCLPVRVSHCLKSFSLLSSLNSQQSRQH